MVLQWVGRGKGDRLFRFGGLCKNVVLYLARRHSPSGILPPRAGPLPPFRHFVVIAESFLRVKAGYGSREVWNIFSGKIFTGQTAKGGENLGIFTLKTQ